MLDHCRKQIHRSLAIIQATCWRPSAGNGAEQRTEFQVKMDRLRDWNGNLRWEGQENSSPHSSFSSPKIYSSPLFLSGHLWPHFCPKVDRVSALLIGLSRRIPSTPRKCCSVMMLCSWQGGCKLWAQSFRYFVKVLARLVCWAGHLFAGQGNESKVSSSQFINSEASYNACLAESTSRFFFCIYHNFIILVHRSTVSG